MALIALACHDTEENGRTALTKETLESLVETVDGREHRIFVIDNGSCQATKELLERYRTIKGYSSIHLITSPENVGTAKAINRAWRHRNPGEHLIKMDNDVVIHSYGWVEELEEATERDPSIGILGLKRKDLLESPDRMDEYQSTLKMLPHKKGERWIIVEQASGVMGTCQMFNHRLIDKIGGLFQMDGVYGFDDTLASIRSTIAGFTNCFLPHIEMDHIDPGGNDYTDWKRKYAGDRVAKFNATKEGLINGTIPIYYPL